MRTEHPSGRQQGRTAGRIRGESSAQTSRPSVFEMLILAVGVAVAYFGFRIIQNRFVMDRIITWEMINAIFIWLLLITSFVFLGIVVDTSKKTLSRFEEILQGMNDRDLKRPPLPRRK
ncbi:MAG: hypothetical protein GXP63_01140 [DPANN group archaeon]|nr:hypothetical protein [DPANN group archaeon]